MLLILLASQDGRVAAGMIDHKVDERVAWRALDAASRTSRASLALGAWRACGAWRALTDINRDGLGRGVLADRLGRQEPRPSGQDQRQSHEQHGKPHRGPAPR